MDVNGAEMGVIRHNLLPLLLSRRIEHFFCEFDVAAWPKFHPPGTPTIATITLRNPNPNSRTPEPANLTQPFDSTLIGTNATSMHLAGARLLVQIISSGYRATSLRIQRMPNPSHHGWRTGVNQSDSSEAFWQEYLLPLQDSE